MNRMLSGTILALMLAAGAARETAAGGAVIETTAPLADLSEEAVKTAVVAAMEKAARGARAMGFAWIQLWGAHVLGQEVVVQIAATDEDPDEAAAGDPDAGPPDGDGAPHGEPKHDEATPGATRI